MRIVCSSLCHREDYIFLGVSHRSIKVCEGNVSYTLVHSVTATKIRLILSASERESEASQ